MHIFSFYCCNYCDVRLNERYKSPGNMGGGGSALLMVLLDVLRQSSSFLRLCTSLLFPLHHIRNANEIPITGPYFFIPLHLLIGGQTCRIVASYCYRQWSAVWRGPGDLRLASYVPWRRVVNTSRLAFDVTAGMTAASGAWQKVTVLPCQYPGGTSRWHSHRRRRQLQWKKQLQKRNHFSYGISKW